MSTMTHLPGSGQRVRPTHVRWHVMVLMTIVAALTFLDRVNLSIAGQFIEKEFHLSTQSMGWILSAFVLAYALSQVPCGWLGDRYGPRTVITVAILWWSIFSAATAIAPNLPLARWLSLAWSFAIVRFLIGLGEGATFPNSNKIVAAWMGTAQRGVGNSIFLAGIGVGGAVTPILIAWIMNNWGWRASFCVCGALGPVVALGWHLYVTNRPSEHRGVNAGELALIGSVEGTPARVHSRTPSLWPPWRSILSSVSVWSLALSFSCLGYAAYIFYTFFFIYLVEARHLTVLRGGVWGSTPFVAMAILTPLGGVASDFAVKKLGKRRGRQCGVWIGVSIAAVCLWRGGHTTNTTLAILMLASAAGFVGFASANWWAACIDLTENFSGSLSGLMNMVGNFGGWISPVLTAYIATHFGWTRAFDFAALLTLIAGASWLLVNADQNLE